MNPNTLSGSMPGRFPVRRFLPAVMALAVGALSAAATAQQKQHADPDSAAAEACRSEVRSRVNQKYPNNQNFRIHRGQMQQWEKSSRELAFEGEGEVQLGSGGWEKFSCTCTYNTRRESVAEASVSWQVSETPSSTPSATSGSGSSGSQIASSSIPSYGVTLYRDLDFRGTSQTFTSDLSDLRGSRVGDDQATSVAVRGGCRARLHQDLDFRGTYIEISADVRDLRQTRIGDDSITSIEVRCSGKSDWSSDRDSGSGDDSWDSGDSSNRSGNYGVTLYRDPDFQGRHQTFTQDVPDLWDTEVGNDQTTSVSISRGCRARLYRDSEYRGSYVEIDSDSTDLRGSQVGDDTISSLKVRCEDEWGSGGRSNADGLTLYRDPQFGGTSETFESDVRDLRGSRIGDDQATSASINRGCRARLYQDPDFRGAYIEIDSDVSDLRGSRVGDDAVSSIQVRCDR